MEHTVGTLATALGVQTHELIARCEQLGILVWGEQTPLSDEEQQRVTAALGLAAPPPGPPEPEAWADLPPSPLPPPPPPPPPSSGRGSKVGVVVAVCVAAAVVLIAAVTLLGTESDDPEHDADLAEMSQAVEELGEVDDPADLAPVELGDCIDTGLGDDFGEFVIPRRVPCEQSHEAEVFHVHTDPSPPDAPWPGDAGSFQIGGEGCFEEFLAFVGDDALAAGYDFLVLYPNEFQWERLAQRDFRCAAYRVDGTPLTGTVEGAAAN